MIDIYLEPTTHDIVVSNFDIQLVAGSEQVLQSIKMRLLMIFDEWFLDSSAGVPYYELIAVKNPDLSLVDSILKATIQETTGVLDLLSYSSIFTPSTRSLSVTFHVNTKYGETGSTLGVV